MEWVTDDNGNRASVKHWGSREKAEASLKTLANCTDCTGKRLPMQIYADQEKWYTPASID